MDACLAILREAWPKLNWRRTLYGPNDGTIEGFVPPVVDENGNVRGGLEVLVLVRRVGDFSFSRANGTAGHWTVEDAVARYPDRIISSTRPTLLEAVNNYREVSLADLLKRVELHKGGSE